MGGTRCCGSRGTRLAGSGTPALLPSINLLYLFLQVVLPLFGALLELFEHVDFILPHLLFVAQLVVFVEKSREVQDVGVLLILALEFLEEVVELRIHVRRLADFLFQSGLLQAVVQQALQLRHVGHRLPRSDLAAQIVQFSRELLVDDERPAQRSEQHYVSGL